MSDLEALRRLLADKNVLAFTGAGVSAESGVPTFRGAEGLWKTHRPEELATEAAFNANPELVWEWYTWRRRIVGACEPNGAHRALAALSARSGIPIVTQNVDGLHLRALREEVGGDPQEDLTPVELHGSLFRSRCTGCGTEVGDDPPDNGSDPLPRCHGCGALLRPAVVWFGESLKTEALDRAHALAAAADVCLVVGTSAVVYPAAGVPLTTLASGGTLIEVNPEPTPLSPHAAWVLRGPAAEILPDILTALLQGRRT